MFTWSADKSCECKCEVLHNLTKEACRGVGRLIIAINTGAPGPVVNVLVCHTCHMVAINRKGWTVENVVKEW